MKDKLSHCQEASEIPLHPPEAVKKLFRLLFASFRRKPESRFFKDLQTNWTPVFTGVTTKRQFLHTFPFSKGERVDFFI